jgi:hypothetical protein
MGLDLAQGQRFCFAFIVNKSVAVKAFKGKGRMSA